MNICDFVNICSQSVHGFLRGYVNKNYAYAIRLIRICSHVHKPLREKILFFLIISIMYKPQGVYPPPCEREHKRTK